MSEEKEIEWESWGVQMMDGMKHQKNPWVCPFCGYIVANDLDVFDSFIVGFYKERELSFHECPECFKIFYRHIARAGFEFITNSMENNSDFLQVQEAREEFLKMLKRQEKRSKKVSD